MDRYELLRNVVLEDTMAIVGDILKITGSDIRATAVMAQALTEVATMAILTGAPTTRDMSSQQVFEKARIITRKLLATMVLEIDPDTMEIFKKEPELAKIFGIEVPVEAATTG